MITLISDRTLVTFNDGSPGFVAQGEFSILRSRPERFWLFDVKDYYRLEEYI